MEGQNRTPGPSQRPRSRDRESDNFGRRPRERQNAHRSRYETHESRMRYQQEIDQIRSIILRQRAQQRPSTALNAQAARSSSPKGSPAPLRPCPPSPPRDHSRVRSELSNSGSDIRPSLSSSSSSCPPSQRSQNISSARNINTNHSRSESEHDCQDGQGESRYGSSISSRSTNWAEYLSDPDSELWFQTELPI